MGPRILIYSLVIVLSILEISFSGPVAIYRHKREADCKPTAENLKDAVKSITKAQDMRLEAELLMKPYTNWEELVMPASISIALLGELAAISKATGDFSINLNPPAGGFKYMKYPESISASLMQVCNTAWASFSTADKNMDRIRLLTHSLTSSTKELVVILFQPTATVNAILPQRLRSVLSTSNECTPLAQSVEASFTNTIRLIQEVLEACVNSKRGYEKQMADEKITLEQVAIIETVANKSVQMAEEFKKMTETQLTDAADAYTHALKNVPSVWETMAANFMGGVLDTLSFTPNRFISKEVGTDTPANGTEGIVGASATVDTAGAGDVKSIQATNNICSKSNQMIAISEGLRKVLDSKGKTINMNIVYDERANTVTTNYVKRLALSLKQDIADGAVCKAKTLMDAVLQSAVAVCEDLETAALSKNTDESYLKSLAQRVNTIFSNSIKVDSYCKAVTNSQPLQQKPPYAAGTVGPASIGTLSAQMAYVRMEQATIQLKRTQDMYKESFEKVKKENEKLTAILAKMRSHKLEQIDVDTAKKMLIKGLESLLESLGKVKEQWEKMIYSFQMISSLIKSCMGKNFNELVQSAKTEKSIPNYSSEAFVKDMLYSRAFASSIVVHLVNKISSTYCEVSQRYLMDRASTLGRMLTMSTSNPEYQIEREKFQSSFAEAQKSIEALVILKKQEFDLSIEARVKTIICQIGAAIPPLSAEEKKHICDDVNAGANAAKGSSKMELDLSSFT
ncbi:uncharacterized protein LOC144819255 [Lissotriton helveticus]